MQALVRWGGALLELAHYKQGHDSFDMIQEAIAKLKKALEAEPERADAEWCLGNAYTSLGFLCPEKPKAMEQFTKASSCFKRCHDKDSSNETYKKALEMCEKAPEYYGRPPPPLSPSLHLPTTGHFGFPTPPTLPTCLLTIASFGLTR